MKRLIDWIRNTFAFPRNYRDEYYAFMRQEVAKRRLEQEERREHETLA
jgi:hypothetical protein